MRCYHSVLSCHLATALALLLTAAAPRLVRGAEPAAAPPLFPFVLPWDDASPGVTNVSAWLEKPAGKLGRVYVKEGHLFTGSQRLRLLGVNLCCAP